MTQTQQSLITLANSMDEEKLCDLIARMWRDHAYERSGIALLQCILRDRMMADGVRKMKTPHGTEAVLRDPKFYGTPSQRRAARARDAGPQLKVYYTGTD